MARKRTTLSGRRIKRAVEKSDLATTGRLGVWRNHPIVSALGKISELADQPPLYAICSGMVVAGILRSDIKLCRTGMRMLAAEWLATKAKSLVKHRIDRTRPHVAMNGGQYHMANGHSHQSALSSFPSGHTAGAVAVARAYASEYPEHAIVVTLLAAFAGAIQIPRCAHFASDVGAGAIIGLTAGSLVAKADPAPVKISR